MFRAGLDPDPAQARPEGVLGDIVLICAFFGGPEETQVELKEDPP